MRITHKNIFGIKAGSVITFTNKVNYFVTLVVSRVEEKSWYVGNGRNSYGTLKSYAKHPDFKITNPED